MTRAIFRKALSDIRGRPLQVVLLFLVIAAAATTLSVALNVQASASKPYERLREESNGADAWFNSFGSSADLSRLTDLDIVEEVGEPYPVSFENYGIRNGDRKQQIALVGMGPDLPDFDHPVVTRGRWLEAGGRDEIVVDSGAANILGLKVGQKIDLLTPGGNRPLTVVGFAVTASRTPAPISDPAFAYVLPETLYSITPGVVYGSGFDHTMRVGVRLREGVDSGVLFGEARNLGGQVGISTWENVREVSKEINQFDVIFLQVFAVFGLFASGLIIANAVGGQVLSQMRDIGVLKAIGFTPRQVSIVLLLQNLGLSVVAGVVGVLAGLLIAPFFLQRSADILGVSAGASFNAVIALITLAVVTIIVGVFTLAPAWRAGRVSAIAALNAENDSRSAGISRLGKLAAALGLPRVAVVGIKDVSRRPMRTAMTVVALALAVVTATFSLGIESTFDQTMDDPTVIGGPPFDIGADRDALPDAEARAILNANPDVESYLPSMHTGARIGNQGFELWGFEGDLNNPRWAMREGRMPTARGEAAVSTQLTRSFGIDVGDTVTVLYGGGPQSEGTPIELTIVGRFVSAEGENMHVTRDTIPDDEAPTDYMIVVREGADPRVVADALIEASRGNFDPEVLSETIDDIRKEWRPVILGLNLVLFTIAGINLLSSQLLSIRERRRDFAVLKAVGFTPSQIVGSVFAGSALLALVGVAVGIPLGLVVTRVVLDILSSAAGIGPGVGVLPGIVWLAPLVPIALVVAALASAIPARIASGLKVAEALRYE